MLAPSVPQDYQMNEVGQYIPFCPVEEWVPKLEQTFDNIEAGRKFYEQYAVSVGFSVRSYSRTKDSKGSIWKVFVCSKEGWTPGKKTTMTIYEGGRTGLQSDEAEDSQVDPEGADGVVTPVVTRRRKPVIREGCTAKLTLRSTKEGKFKVVTFNVGHSHELTTPSKRHLERSARSVSRIHIDLVNKFSRANVGPSKSFHLFKETVGSYEGVGCTLQDLRNYHQSLKNVLVDMDAEMFVEILRRNKMRDPGFYYAFEVDDDKKLKCVFWCDSESRRDYSSFGELISFDTKHKTNKYKMVFAAFTGLNHHRKLVSFGAGLLRDEKTESFVWLFQKFADAMQDYHPDTIVTDQDLAIKEGVDTVFTNSIHRYVYTCAFQYCLMFIALALEVHCVEQNDLHFNMCMFK